MLKTPDMTAEDKRQELLKCAASPLYFISNYCFIYDAPSAKWIKFSLWPAQMEVLSIIHAFQKNIFLKARQLGLTWLALGYALWTMLFRPIAEVLLFSRREDEALYLLSEERLRGMYRCLPGWMQSKVIVVDARSHLRFSNGSGARAFPSNAGDSYTATFALVDEADLVPDFKDLLNKVQPTVEAGGKIVLVSRVDKSKPESHFKQIYRAAKAEENEWHCLFLPWNVHPDRDQAWYDTQKRDVLRNTGSLDDLHEQYPASDAEALSPRTLDKRIAPAWLQQCYEQREPISDEELPDNAPSIPGLKIYELPQPYGLYMIGADPAEGNPTSDDSALTVGRVATGEEVASLAGKFQPSVLASYIDQLGRFFNSAQVMVERNNHGHAVILWLGDNSPLPLLNGYDDKTGWHSTSKGKALLYDATADAFRNEETIIHSFETMMQLSFIEGSTLRAPEGAMDDKADGYALMLAGIKYRTALYIGVW